MDSIDSCLPLRAGEHLAAFLAAIGVEPVAASAPSDDPHHPPSHERDVRPSQRTLFVT